MTKELSDRFTHPFPKPFNRIEVWAVSRQRKEFKAELLGSGLNSLFFVIGSVIPNNDDLSLCAAYPLGEMLEKCNRIVAITLPLLSKEALTRREIVSPITRESLPLPRYDDRGDCHFHTHYIDESNPRPFHSLDQWAKTIGWHSIASFLPYTTQNSVLGCGGALLPLLVAGCFRDFLAIWQNWVIPFLFLLTSLG
jgi:hypothetical protein